MNGGEVTFYFKGDGKDLEKKTKSLGDIIKGNLISTAITKGISSVTKGISSIGNAISSLVTQPGLDRALNIENAQFKLQGLGNTAEQTQQIMDNALAAVKGTAYGLDEAATVAASAVAAGIKPGEELERTLKLVGDAAAISGRDMASMGAIFNKVATSGKLQGEELNQFADAGIPIVQLLADTMGKTTSEIYDMASAGEIGFAQLQNAIESGMGGAALTMGQTFDGALSNMKAAFSRIGATIMGPIEKGLTPIMGNITNIVDAIASGSTDVIDEEMAKLGENVNSMISNFITTLGPILQNAIPVVAQVLTNLATMLPDLINQLLPPLIENLTTLLNALVEAFPTIVQALMGMLPIIVDALVDMLPTLTQALIEGLIILIQALAEQLPILLPQIIDAVLEIVPLLIDCIPQLLNAGAQLIGGLLAGIVNSIPTILARVGDIAMSIVKSFGSISLNDIGSNLLKGLWNGIKSAKDWVLDKIADIGGSIMKKIKGIFGVHSPSTEFAWVGKMNMLGLEKGMEDMKPDLQKTFDGMFDLSPSLYGSTSNNLSPQVNVINNINMKQDPLGQMVNDIKTFSGGSKNDYNYGMGV